MVYQRLRDMREDLDLSQAELGAKINLTQRAYSYYETGKRMPPPWVFGALADFYGTSVDYLMGRTDEPKPYPPLKHKQKQP